MGRRDRRIDAYIARSPDFARPILRHLRQIVHRACPDVEETLKWNMPAFMYKGILCQMAAFKQHATFGFWKQNLMKDVHRIFARADSAMGSLGPLTSVSDLPSDKVLGEYVREAMRLNEEGVRVPKERKFDRKPLRIPAYFRRVLASDKKALATFEAFPPSHRREYIEWIAEAKTVETRNKRIAKTLEWLSKGKSRNWKYEK